MCLHLNWQHADQNTDAIFMNFVSLTGTWWTFGLVADSCFKQHTDWPRWRGVMLREGKAWTSTEKKRTEQVKNGPDHSLDGGMRKSRENVNQQTSTWKPCCSVDTGQASDDNGTVKWKWLRSLFQTLLMPLRPMMKEVTPPPSSLPTLTDWHQPQNAAVPLHFKDGLLLFFLGATIPCAGRRWWSFWW